MFPLLDPLIRPVQARARTLRVLYKVVTGDLRPPSEATPARPAASGPRSGRARQRRLEVVRLGRPTRDTLEIAFANPPSDPIRFEPGQHLIVSVEIEGRLHRRAYSLCSTPSRTEELVVVVKRLPEGLVSSYLHDHLQVGDRLDVLGPSGRFGLASVSVAARPVLLVAGGVGITPLYSILLHLAEAGHGAPVTLVYANRDVQSVLFYGELVELAARWSAFELRLLLEEPGAGVEAMIGRCEGPLLEAALPIRAGTEVFLCGPPPMMEKVEAYLMDRGVDRSRIHRELFRPSNEGKSAALPEQAVPLHFRRSGRTIEEKPNQTILEAALAAGVALDFSCTMGGCAACRVRLLEGEVFMEEPNCLSPEEREAGYCLPCISYALTPLSLEA